jgi:glycerophosphoryl diester phosphodiesterase
VASVPGLDWLTIRPIAHRGLHDARSGVIENTPSSFAAAIAGGYGIECDLQVSADGEAMVYHDQVLERLTQESGRLDHRTAAELVRIPFRGTPDRMITLGGLCDLVSGRAALVIELKSRFNGDHRLVRRATSVLSGYRGPAALMSFDPEQIEAVRRIAPQLPRGMVAERHYRDWDTLPAARKRALGRFQHVWRTQPQFIAYWVRDLPAAVPWVARRMLGLPLLAWTVRSESERERAARYVDQIIFEGFLP